MSVLYPSEVSLNDLELGTSNDHIDGDFSVPIYHCGEPLVIQLSNCIDLFGVLGYRNPTGHSNTIRYSTGICMSNSNPTIRHFAQIVRELEKMVKHEFAQKDWTFISTIKANKKGEKHLRVKLPFKYNAMQFEVYNNKKRIFVDINVLKEALTHGRTIDVILQLNPVWCSGKKYGISWKMCAIDFQQKQFRQSFDHNEVIPRSPPDIKQEHKRAKRRGRKKPRVTYAKACESIPEEKTAESDEANPATSPKENITPPPSPVATTDPIPPKPE